MVSGSPMVIVAGGCCLMAALALVRGWRIGVWLVAAGAIILAGALAARGLRAGRWPLTNEYEFALAFALAASLTVLVPSPATSRWISTAQAAVMLLAALLVTYARFVLPSAKQSIRAVPAALNSVWLPLHVGTAALACGALALGGTAGLAWLLHERVSSDAKRSESGEIEWLLDRTIAAGFPLLTLSMFFGMIWAEAAWGRYWSWDLKETWTLITWLVYALYWHVRRRPRWQGRRLAWLALVGLASVLFTFFVIGWLARIVGLESLHLF